MDGSARVKSAVFSAHAEVFPTKAYVDGKIRSLLRTRGGISFVRTRTRFPRKVFSAHAEVFPEAVAEWGEELRLLRTRGGIS